MRTVAHLQLGFTGDGRARIGGTGIKVRNLAEDYSAGATLSELFSLPTSVMNSIPSGHNAAFDRPFDILSTLEEGAVRLDD